MAARLVGGRVMGDAATARSEAHESDSKIPGFSIASTLQSLARVSQLGTQQQAVASELASKSAGVCGQR